MIIAKCDKVVTKKLDIVTDCVVKYLCEHGITVSTAESCTGGILSSAITSVAGASGIFELGMCCYSERVKESVLGVDEKIITQYGVYSFETAKAMASGIRKLSDADIGVGITGIAGPHDDSVSGKRAGTVYISVCSEDKEITRELRLFESLAEVTRENVRAESAATALMMVAELVGLEIKEVI